MVLLRAEESVCRPFTQFSVVPNSPWFWYMPALPKLALGPNSKTFARVGSSLEICDLREAVRAEQIDAELAGRKILTGLGIGLEASEADALLPGEIRRQDHGIVDGRHLAAGVELFAAKPSSEPTAPNGLVVGLF